jgi:antitoxin (DNA-binding transcriptional repressor) of toxin-antitoxin stability system
MDLSFLRALYDRPGPFASVYLDMRRTESPRAVEVRRHVRCKELADQGAPPETIGAVERVVQDEKEQRESGFLAVFACGREVAYSVLLDGPASSVPARYAPLPHVRPLLAQRGEPVARLVAVVNRLGARITCVARDGTRWDAEVPPAVVSPVHKPKGGDMFRQPHNQRAAEDAWRANAKRIAQAVDRTAGVCAADVVVVAGDVRARAAVLGELSEPVLARTVESERSGGPGLNADVAAAVEACRAERIRSAVDRFEEQLTKHGRAVGGLSAVVGALRAARVASLLVEERTDAATPVWTGPRCTDLATSPGELRDLGVSDPVADRADAALIRALTGTDGELLLVAPDEWRATQDMGALLRYAER